MDDDQDRKLAYGSLLLQDDVPFTCNQLHREPSALLKDTITKNGLLFEEYQVSLEQSNTFIDIIRIAKNFDQNERNPMPVVLLQHGLFDSSDFWIEENPNSKEKPIGIELALRNNEVWLGNNRGGKYSGTTDG